ncbi:unnamed protein product [Amoebophrya sp. A120]|nr:unnamed protein product [Amoebophrya sp. A120]|eukprot:GSA120T00021706001.1
MSRAADAQSKKKDQKAAMAATRDRKAELLAMGLTSTMKKQIGDDALLCVGCGATKHGPLRCDCRGGSSKPTADFDALPYLIAAAKARHEQQKEQDKHDHARHQAEKERERKGRKENKGEVDLDAEYDEVDGVEIRQLLQFPVGKLGMDIERNVVVKVSPEGNAHDLKVRVGWVIAEVDGVAVVPDKKKIITALTKVFKANKPCPIRFRCPLSEEEEAAAYWFCFRCDKFLEQVAFDAQSMADKTAGQRACASCEECADMFDDDDEDDY